MNINDNVVEGNPAKFQISTLRTSNQDRIINVSVIQVGDYYSGEELQMVELRAYEFISEFEIATDADTDDEDYGKIIATVLPGSDYTLASFRYIKAQITMVDDDVELPVASIEPVSTTAVVEGTDVLFRVSLTSAPN